MYEYFSVGTKSKCTCVNRIMHTGAGAVERAADEPGELVEMFGEMVLEGCEVALLAGVLLLAAVAHFWNRLPCKRPPPTGPDAAVYKSNQTFICTL